MAAWRRAIELSLGDSDVEKLRLIARSRTEPASRVERARILLGYWENSSFFAVGQRLDCTIRQSRAASSGRWPKARWPRWTIAFALGQIATLRPMPDGYGLSGGNGDF